MTSTRNLELFSISSRVGILVTLEASSKIPTLEEVCSKCSEYRRPGIYWIAGAQLFQYTDTKTYWMILYAAYTGQNISYINHYFTYIHVML